MEKRQILIVDDEEINREVLKSMFQDEYIIYEAADGGEAISHIAKNRSLSLVLLDIAMPVMDGFDVLKYMHEHELLQIIPVILITSETVIDSEDKAYTYGAADVIHKPFYPHIVKKRSCNIIELYQSKLDMERRLKEQEQEIRAQERKIRENSEFMLDALSSVIETRSLETGEHTRHIKYYTRAMLKQLQKAFPKYGMTGSMIEQIVSASALHDIGKVGIPDAVLLKPGRLTKEEFEIMKTHTTIGCEMLQKTYRDKESMFYRYSYDICRHHHERWDGSGYPDHLAGADIPLCAQVTAVADVYDALVSPRIYKGAFTNEQAFAMIMNGECGQFSPDMLECFRLAREDFFHMVEVVTIFEL